MTQPDPLPRTAANHVPLSPLSFLPRAALGYPDHPAFIHGPVRHTWSQVYARCRRLASALAQRGIQRGDVVAILAPNIPAMWEALHGVPMLGAILNPINTRLDPGMVATILEHGEAKLLLSDTEHAPLVKEALARLDNPPPVIDIDDPVGPGGERLGDCEYEDLLAGGDPDFAWSLPADEWDPLTLNYTSGTTARPKGVLYSHRGAYLTAVGNVLAWGGMGLQPTYLWTLPMFHCSGWCFPWTITALGGTHVGLRKVAPKPIYDAFADHGVTHLCGAPIVMQMILNASAADARPFDQKVQMMTAAAPPPASVLAAMAEKGISVTHTYGLTEVYGPAMVCAWHQAWDALPIPQQAEKKSCQGIAYPTQEGVMVADPDTMRPVPADGETLGEVMMQGNMVMKGYLKDGEATDKAFAGGWFHTGDLAVVHPDGYVQLRDRSKDIIISGGENISSIEVEDALYTHPAVASCAVVAKPHPKWGETPVAFVELAPGVPAVTAEDLIAHCRARIAHYKCPTEVRFEPIAKTVTGKVQKHILRKQVAEG